jgi:hypothetical protein
VPDPGKYPMPEMTQQVFQQLNATLKEKAREAGVLKHNLEHGLANEQAVRNLLSSFLPLQYGVGKGKVVNARGELSRQCDIILYDAIQCPKLFIDENGNQLLPVEGVYSVIEVKTTLNKSNLRDAFENLHSVHQVAQGRNHRISSNPKVDYHPPQLDVLSFEGSTLPTLRKHYEQMSTEFPVTNSFTSYSHQSPGHTQHSGLNFLVHHVWMIGTGCIHHNYSGRVRVREYEQYTLGMFLTSLLMTLEKIPVGPVNMRNYLNHLMIEPDGAAHRSRGLELRKVERHCDYCGGGVYVWSKGNNEGTSNSHALNEEEGSRPAHRRRPPAEPT